MSLQYITWIIGFVIIMILGMFIGIIKPNFSLREKKFHWSYLWIIASLLAGSMAVALILITSALDIWHKIGFIGLIGIIYYIVFGISLFIRRKLKKPL